MFEQRIAVNQRVKDEGISTASKYHCCLRPAEESVDHLLVKSEIASEIWSKFASLLGSLICSGSVLYIRYWLPGGLLLPRHPIQKWVSKILPCLSWKARNKARFEGISMRVAEISEKINCQIGNIGNANAIAFNFSWDDIFWLLCSNWTLLLTDKNLISQVNVALLIRETIK